MKYMNDDDKIFMDTNLWVYLYTKSPEAKYKKVKQIVNTHFRNIVVSTQILGELYHVLTRKGFQSNEKAKEIIVETIANFPVSEISTLNVVTALDIHDKYKYSYWDSLLIATALLNHFPYLYSEDMQHNQLIEDKTRIINPFSLDRK